LAETVSRSNWFNIDAAKRDLGYASKISTNEGLRRLEEWLDKKNITI
jgi:nucleoside-diphosphate-sugar epimerase